MTKEERYRFSLKSIRYRIHLFIFVFFASSISTISAQNLCPLKCSCFLNNEPRKIICSEQELEYYPGNISDLVQHLDLSRNSLESLPNELNDLIELEYLNVARNKLKSLPNDLQQLQRLQKLDLSGNEIIEINKIASISHLIDLKVLYLSKNPLTSLDDLRNFALRAIDASKCSISEISEASLRGLPELVTLSLEGNPLKSIQRLTSEKLRWLDLSDCCLNYLRPDTFEGAPDLEQLRLSNNPTLVYSSRNETLRHDNLKRLDVSGCNLDRPGLHGFPALTHAVLSKNLIRMLPDRIFWKNRALVQLHLSGNGIGALNRSSFAGLIKLEALDLSSNSINQLQPFTFREAVNLRLLNLSFNDFEKFPSIMTTVSSLDLSSNYIRIVNRQIFGSLPRLRTLNLSDNRLEIIRDEFDSDTLKNLILKGNRIVELSNTSFFQLPQLQKLDLSGNRLTQAIDLKIFASNENLRSVVLEDNPWRCDCHLLHPTFIYLTELPQKTRAETLVCQSPSNVSGFSWEVACFNDWHTESRLEKDKTWGLIMLILMVAVLVFGTSVSLRHTFMMKRQERRERSRIEREEGIERLRLLRRRNRELEAAATNLSSSEPRIHPLELINPPPYEEAVQMPRMAQSLDALDSISMDPMPSRIVGSVDNLRSRKRRSRRPRNRARSEENLSRREERHNTRRIRSSTRRNYSPSLMSIASRHDDETDDHQVQGNASISRNNVARKSSLIVVENESEERSTSDSRRRPRPQTPTAKRKRRRQVAKNGNSTDDEDSDMNNIGVGERDIMDDKGSIVIRELPREPRSACYRTTSQPRIV